MIVTRRPSIRSRLTASFVAFGIGFVLANVGLLVVPRPDTWVWVAVAVVLMGTGVLGVVYSDARSSVSIWAVTGVELFAAATLLPLLWTFSQATAPDGEQRTTLLPTTFDGGGVGDLLIAGPVRSALVTSLLIGVGATLLAMLVAVPAAYALVRLEPRGRRWWYLVFVVALVLPTFVLAAPWVATLLDLGVGSSRIAMIVPSLALAVPFAVWLSVRVLQRAPWSLADAVRADGASLGQRVRHFALPTLGGDLLLVAVLVFFWTAGDFALGAGLAPTDAVRPLPATLLALGDERLVAATGLVWALPLVIVVAVFARRIIPWFGPSSSGRS